MWKSKKKQGDGNAEAMFQELLEDAKALRQDGEQGEDFDTEQLAMEGADK